MRAALALVTALAAVVTTGGSGDESARWPPASVPPPGSPTAVTYALPVAAPARLVAGFDPPRSRYGAGHRGVDLAVIGHDAVRAAADGTVLFAGSVAGRGVVVVAHPDGITTEYEPLRVEVRAGHAISRGSVIGTVSGHHRSCAPDACLHWAARRGAVYVDPMTLLMPLGPVRLIPWLAGQR